MIKKIVVTAIALMSFLAADAQAAIPEDVVKETIIKHSMEKMNLLFLITTEIF